MSQIRGGPGVGELKTKGLQNRDNFPDIEWNLRNSDLHWLALQTLKEADHALAIST